MRTRLHDTGSRVASARGSRFEPLLPRHTPLPRALAHAGLVSLVAASALGCASPSTEARYRSVSSALSALEDEEADARARAPETRGGEGPTSFSSCAEIVQRVLVSDPRLLAPRERARASLARARAALAHPAPSLDFSIWEFPITDPALADREGMYMLELSQELPPNSALDGESRASVEEARETLAELSELRRELSLDAARECVGWLEASTRVRLSRELQEVLQAARATAQVRYEAGSEALVDLLRMDRELASLERAIERASADERRALEALRARLGLDGSSALEVAAALPEEALELDDGRALRLAREHRGAFEAAAARVDAARARAQAAEARASVPTFMLGVMYMQTPGMEPGAGLELGMTLPWFWSGEGDEAEAARAEARASEAEARGLERSVLIEIRDALASYRASEASLRVLRDRERPAAQAFLDATAEAYGAGDGSLIDWLDALLALRELDLEALELQNEVALQRLEVLGAIGIDLTEALAERAPSASTPAAQEDAAREDAAQEGAAQEDATQ